MLSYPRGEWRANSSLSTRPPAMEKWSSHCFWWLTFRLHLRFTFRLYLRFTFRLRLRFTFRLRLGFVFRLHLGFTFCLHWGFLRGRLGLRGRCLGFDNDTVFVTEMLRREIGKIS